MEIDERERNISVLIGKTLESIINKETELLFNCSDGTRYVMFHNADYCESVTLDDIIGDLNDLVGSPIIRAEVSENHNNPKPATLKEDNSHTWTFYKLATINGWVDLRWYGESNGYYSESVNFWEIE